MKKHNYFVYIVTNYNKSVLYVGITSALLKRIMEHYNGLSEGFTKRYNCKYLVFYEHYSDVNLAISREKQIKKWSRKKKEGLINKLNPERNFFNEGLVAIESAYT